MVFSRNGDDSCLFPSYLYSVTISLCSVSVISLWQSCKLGTNGQQYIRLQITFSLNPQIWMIDSHRPKYDVEFIQIYEVDIAYPLIIRPSSTYLVDPVLSCISLD